MMTEPDPAVGESDTLLLSGVDDEELDFGPTPPPPSSTASISLIKSIISPSPFAHHHDAATADRYRSALQRIQVSPQSDVEAWQAIMNECLTLYRSQVLPSMEEERHTYRHILRSYPQQRPNAAAAPPPPFRPAESLDQQLDWIESCHGHVLQFFPYASHYYVSVLEILLARSALLFESLTGGEITEDDLLLVQSLHPIGSSAARSQDLYQHKIQEIFQRVLGIPPNHKDTQEDSNMDTFQTTMATTTTTATLDEDMVLYGASKQSNQLLGGMCVSSIELWLLYIRKQTRDAKRIALSQHLADTLIPPSLSNLSSTGEEYIRGVITDAYETALKSGAAYAINNHLIWKQYLIFVKSWNVIQTKDSMTQVDHNLLQKQRQTLRSIYQRMVAIPMTGLDSFWIEYETFEKAQSEQLAVALVSEYLPKYQHARSVYLERNRVVSLNELRIGRLATPPVDMDLSQKTENSLKASSEGKWMINQEEYYSKMKDECVLLAKWQKRCAYERTNPERLSAADLSERIRLVYKEFVSCFMRHVEVWNEWSTWELFNTSGKVLTASHQRTRNVNLSLAVLAIGQHHLPDSTLLAYMEANVLEAHSPAHKPLGASDEDTSVEHPSVHAMTKFCNRNPTTLGFVLLQRFVYKYKGKQEARAVFGRARRILQVRSEDASGTINDASADNHGGGGEDASKSTLDSMHQRFGKTNGSKSMVMHRGAFFHTNGDTHLDASVSGYDQSANKSIVGKGVITWHLYASHASIEHRLNAAPHIAARIFELGLRKHRTFLSIPQYVLQYAALLLELKDEDNLRALLSRSITACEEDLINDQDAAFPSGMSHLSKKDAQRPLWDLMLKFESVLSSGDSTAEQTIEARRRRALYGPQHEDIAGGDMASLGTDGDIGIGMQKSNLGEVLIRSEGYDVCSRISNGMHRIVDSLETTGLWADGYSVHPHISQENPLNSLWKDDDGSSGASDASFRRRVIFKEHYRLFSAFPNLGDGGTGGSSGKLLSVKERLAQGTTQTPTASFIAQTMPEWIRGLVLLLPLNPRILRGAKAPPHLIEITLAALRESSLPTERPSDDEKGLNGNINAAGSRKRQKNDEYDSSDDEGDSSHAGGYSDQFRARQRARILDMQTNTNQSS